jgi:hypothetical protein
MASIRYVDVRRKSCGTLRYCLVDGGNHFDET